MDGLVVFLTSPQSTRKTEWEDNKPLFNPISSLKSCSGRSREREDEKPCPSTCGCCCCCDCFVWLCIRIYVMNLSLSFFLGLLYPFSVHFWLNNWGFPFSGVIPCTIHVSATKKWFKTFPKKKSQTHSGQISVSGFWDL